MILLMLHEHRARTEITLRRTRTDMAVQQMDLLHLHLASRHHSALFYKLWQRKLSVRARVGQQLDLLCLLLLLVCE